MTPTANLLARLGLFVQPGFLDLALCQRSHQEMLAAAGAPATVVRHAGELVDEHSRRTKWLQVSRGLFDLLQSRLRDLQPALEAHFQMKLAGLEEPQFLRYRVGDFFLPHRDAGGDDKPWTIQSRRVSVVIFVNRSSSQEAEQTYSGGALTLYGLVGQPEWQKIGFPVTAEAGLLVAFRSEVLHEVTPVAWGERFTIVSWFLGTPESGVGGKYTQATWLLPVCD